MQMTSNRTFLYGTFNAAPPGGISKMFGTDPGVAIEILREFSASELVGKVYVMGSSGNWVPVSQPGVRNYTWYREFPNTKNLAFWIDGSDPWKVLYFRDESDDAGPYVAVGLKLSPRS
jgi:hypothetical protein